MTSYELIFNPSVYDIQRLENLTMHIIIPPYLLAMLLSGGREHSRNSRDRADSECLWRVTSRAELEIYITLPSLSAKLRGNRVPRPLLSSPIINHPLFQLGVKWRGHQDIHLRRQGPTTARAKPLSPSTPPCSIRSASATL